MVIERRSLARHIVLESEGDVHALVAEILSERRERQAALRNLDICDFAEREYYIVNEETREAQRIKLALHQKAVLRYSLQRNEQGYRRFTVLIYSSSKKSGKTTLGGVVGRYIAETQSREGEVYCIGNDFEQAKERSFASIADSVRLSPGATQKAGDWVLPNRWQCQKTKLRCLASGTDIKAISVDARGEAGSNPDLTIWTELWGFQYPEAVKFFVEMTPPPTKPDSIRLIETYAGFEGESDLLESFYKTGRKGRQLTAHELAEAVARDVDGERYEDFLGAFDDAQSADDLVPIWVNDSASMFMYWDSGWESHRMPWQRGPLGDAYYREEEHNLPANEFIRLHLNEWTGAESQFVPMTAWDACLDENIPTIEGDSTTPLVIGVDAATTGDCFGIIAVSRAPVRAEHESELWVRAAKKWDPKEEPGGVLDYSGPEAFLRTACLGGCVLGHPLTPKKDATDARFSPVDSEGAFLCDACRNKNLVPAHNIVQIAYDPYQLHDMMSRLVKEGIVWCEAFQQTKDRLTADRQLYDLIIQRRLHHPGITSLREHVQNANVKLQKDEDSKMRIIKKASDGKIDLVVALSMAAQRCLYLRL